MKIKFGAIVVAGSGKIGGHVASKNRGGAYLRTKVTPTNPNTPAQAGARALLASLSTGWSELTEAQRDSWNGAVKDYATTDIFGDIKNPSGINLYVKLNANLISSGQTALTSAPMKVEIPFSNIASATFDVSTPASSAITFAGSELNGEIVQIRATPVVSAGTSFVKNLFRDVHYDDVTSGVADYGSNYVTKFGTPAVGQIFFISVAVITATGQKGVAQTFKVTATA
jgi:hypothetical protein|tara:strand:+ start:1113 stop:1793 length:681 start_codon:yes stop_codon:yes gene_type:complete